MIVWINKSVGRERAVRVDQLIARLQELDGSALVVLSRQDDCLYLLERDEQVVNGVPTYSRGKQILLP